MQQTLRQILKEALEVKCEDFENIVEESTGLVCSEKNRIGTFEVFGRLLKLMPVGKALVIGDLHGDLESLFKILGESGFLQEMRQNSSSIIIFLGDYGDRGEYSVEVYYTVLRLKMLFPKQIILMRGNHEGPDDLPVYPHDMPFQFQRRFSEKWQSAYARIRELFKCLYNAVIVEERYLMIHGGLPSEAKTIEDLAYAHQMHPKKAILEDMLWSDPYDTIKGICASPRGAGKLFGENVTQDVLNRFKVRILIRGHEPCSEGFKINHKGRILTLFSRKGSPYYNAYGAYLTLKLGEKFQKAEDLTPFIRRF